MIINYKEIADEYGVQTVEELYDLFWDVITSEWTGVYAESFPKHGEISLQRFWKFAFVVDHVWDHLAAADIEKGITRDTGSQFFRGLQQQGGVRQPDYNAQVGQRHQIEIWGNYDKGQTPVFASHAC